MELRGSNPRTLTRIGSGGRILPVMPIRRQNLHNHTLFSDGRFEIHELIESARQAGLEGLGISDHFFTSKIYRGLQCEAWMSSIWPDYLEQTHKARDAHRQGPFRVWAGIEIDSCWERIGLPLERLPWAGINQLDYVLLEYVGEEDIGGMPINQLPALRKHCHVPIILAHPNIEKLDRKIPLQMLVEILRTNKIALEMTAGSRNPWFWAKRDPKPLARLELTIGVDVHDDLSEIAQIDKTLAFIEANGLTANLADPDSLKAARAAITPSPTLKFS